MENFWLKLETHEVAARGLLLGEYQKTDCFEGMWVPIFFGKNLKIIQIFSVFLSNLDFFAQLSKHPSVHGTDHKLLYFIKLTIFSREVFFLSQL